MQRRKFILRTSQLSVGIGLVGLNACNTPSTDKAATTNTTEATDIKPETVDTTGLWFNISLAQWSLNKALFAKELDNLDFAAKARNDFGIGGIEYVNQFFKDKAEDRNYLAQMKQRAADNDVQSLLIMVDREGSLGDMDPKKRKEAVQNHYKWVDAAQFLGCHSIRVNAATDGSREEGAKAATEGLRSLSEYAKQAGLNVIVENHGGFSSDGSWLAGVIAATEMENCGTLPDFGNFCIERNPGGYENGCKTEYDRYKGITELMPYAKAVSAKSHDFNEAGDEVHTDYVKVLKTVKDAGYTGWIGIEYEGKSLTAEEGIRKTLELLVKAGKAVG